MYTILMDIEYLQHHKRRAIMLASVFISALIVVIAASVGRGPVNLQGSLVLSEPNDVTVIAVVEPSLQQDSNATISSITRLRSVDDANGKRPSYDYMVETSDERSILVRLAWDEGEQHWILLTQEDLHGG